MNKTRNLVVLSLLGVVVMTPSAHAREGAFVGLDVGVSEPTNDNYRGHVHTGVSGNPFAGYMFNDFLGLQGQFHVLGQPPDDDKRRFSQGDINNETQWTTMAGLTAGPRLQLPLGELVDLYVTGQGGGFKGLGGRLNQWAPGFSLGGGIDFNITPNVSVGGFGRWNRAYMAPHPYYLGRDAAGNVTGPYPQKLSEQGPEDAQWAVGGITLKYTFGGEEPPPPPPPPAPVAKAPPPPPPPAKKKIVLRNVNFDFDKDNIRADARPILDEAVRILKNETTEAVICEGHTDSKGTDAYNMGLSRRRAGSVKQYLVRNGVAASRIRTEGFGESRPVATNETEDGRAQNRRVELHLE